MKNVICSLLLLIIASPTSAQNNDDRSIYESTLLGVGSSDIYDSYLSPLKYSGINISFLSEKLKMAFISNEHIVEQYLTDVEYINTRNKAGYASQQAGRLSSSYGLFYKFEKMPISHCRLMLGIQSYGLLGFIYNSRNSNNPFSGKMHVGLSASSIMTYSIDLGKNQICFRGQFGVPFVGALFSPDFGQSYYEISIGDSSPLFYLSSFSNYLQLRTLLSVELFLGNASIRMSYLNSFYQTWINNINCQIGSNTFFLGLSRNILKIPARRVKEYRSVLF